MEAWRSCEQNDRPIIDRRLCSTVWCRMSTRESGTRVCREFNQRSIARVPAPPSASIASSGGKEHPLGSVYAGSTRAKAGSSAWAPCGALRGSCDTCVSGGGWDRTGCHRCRNGLSRKRDRPERPLGGRPGGRSTHHPDGGNRRRPRFLHPRGRSFRSHRGISRTRDRAAHVAGEPALRRGRRVGRERSGRTHGASERREWRPQDFELGPVPAVAGGRRDRAASSGQVPPIRCVTSMAASRTPPPRSPARLSSKRNSGIERATVPTT